MKKGNGTLSRLQDIQNGDLKAASPLTYSIAGAAKQLNISRPKAYDLIREGDLITFTIGSRKLVSHESLVRLIRNREEKGLLNIRKAS